MGKMCGDILLNTALRKWLKRTGVKTQRTIRLKTSGQLQSKGDDWSNILLYTCMWDRLWLTIGYIHWQRQHLTEVQTATQMCLHNIFQSLTSEKSFPLLSESRSLFAQKNQERPKNIGPCHWLFNIPIMLSVKLPSCFLTLMNTLHYN